MLRIEIGKKLSVLPLKTLQPTKIHNKSKISLIDFLEKLRGIKPIFTHFSGHFGLQDGRRGSKKFFFAIFQLSSSRPFIWYQICTENPVIRKKVSKPPYPPLIGKLYVYILFLYKIWCKALYWIQVCLYGNAIMFNMFKKLSFS